MFVGAGTLCEMSWAHRVEIFSVHRGFTRILYASRFVYAKVTPWIAVVTNEVDERCLLQMLDFEDYREGVYLAPPASVNMPGQGASNMLSC